LEVVCRLEILKEGKDYVARAYLDDRSIKEYRHPVFEEVATEMALDIQGLLEDNIY
jgi:hypothetical protein